MSLARNILLRMSHSSWLADQVTRRSFTRRAVRRFMPGEEVSDALTAAQTLAQNGLGTVLTQLGENLTTLDEADRVREHYLGVFDQLKGRGSSIHVSVKPTQLGLDLSRDACDAHLEVLAAKAEELARHAREQKFSWAAADGRLEGRELINLRLDAELIVLSACETAKGRVSNGEGVVGLSWSLFAAGASTTMVSLWPVDSASTTELSCESL